MSVGNTNGTTTGKYDIDLTTLLETYRHHVWGDLDTVNYLDSCGNNGIVLHVTHGNEVMNLGNAKEMKWICAKVEENGFKIQTHAHKHRTASPTRPASIAIGWDYAPGMSA